MMADRRWTEPGRKSGGAIRGRTFTPGLHEGGKLLSGQSAAGRLSNLRKVVDNPPHGNRASSLKPYFTPPSQRNTR